MKKNGFYTIQEEPESFHLSYWASNEIKLHLRSIRLKEVDFIKGCVGFAILVLKLLMPDALVRIWKS